MLTAASIKNTGEIGQRWIKAAVIGSLWAAIEIVAGSFLHNLRIPFSGTILSMIAVFLLVSFGMHWKERGIIIRAGIIAALMKSISPSAVILGPMVAIFMEALFLELLLLISGRNLVGFALGGMLAVTWAIFQKAINLLILYGFDLVKIAEALYDFLVNKTGMRNIPPRYMIFLVIALYCLAGLSSATLAFFARKRAQKRKHHSEDNIQLTDADLPFKKDEKKQKYAAVNIFFIVLLLGSSLWFLNRKNFIPVVFTAGGLLVFMVLRYRLAFGKLKKPGLWIQLLIITLLASFLWEWFSTGAFFSVDGLLIGLEMNLRALMIIFSFSAISVEIRNPLVRSILYRNGFARIYKGLTMAFTVLPLAVQNLPSGAELFRKRNSLMTNTINLADQLLKMLDSQYTIKRKIFIISGKVHSGKSTFVAELVRECWNRKMKVMGFLASGTFKDNIRDTFTLKDISTGESFLLAKRQNTDRWIRYKNFCFDPDVLEQGRDILRKARKKNPDLLIVDEVGPMELSGNGWSEEIEILANDYQGIQLWVVRERMVPEVLDRYNIPENNVFSVQSANFKDLCDHLSLTVKALNEEKAV